MRLDELIGKALQRDRIIAETGPPPDEDEEFSDLDEELPPTA